MKPQKLLPVVVAVVAVLGIGWWFMTATPQTDDEAAASPDLTRVEVAKVREGPDDDVRRPETEVRPAEDVPLPSPLRGSVQSIEVESGATVDADAVILRFEQSSQRAELMAARAERSLLEAELERARGRVDEGIVSESEAEDEIQELETRLEAAQQNVETAKAAVEANNIRAPFAATVTLVDVAPGDIVTRGETIARLSSEQERIIRLELPRRLTTDIALGDDLNVSAGDGPTTSARIMALGSAPGAEATTVTLQAVLAEPEGFPVGQTVTVEVPVTGVQTAVVPTAAILEDARGVRVFRVEQGLARSTPVEKGPATDDGLRVRGPLSPGDVVAVSNLEELADGTRVAVVGER